MNIYIVIPAHNEAAFIEKTLQSLAEQTHLPKKILVVDDNSTDATPKMVEIFAERYEFISLLRNVSNEVHLPGSKVINAFNKGFETLDEGFDIICKFDADLIFPRNYLKELIGVFKKDPEIGMAGGFCYIEKNGEWVLENLTGKDHIRGALKAYRRECFEEIGGLKTSMGWDTADELLAQFHGWKIATVDDLVVKHLKPTGHSYNKAAKLKQGEAFYKLRYGFVITLIASLKLAVNKRNLPLTFDYLEGFLKAWRRKEPFLVSQKEGAFIRRLRYRKIWEKLLNKS